MFERNGIYYSNKVIKFKEGTKLNTNKIVVKAENCPQNHICPPVLICPVGALKQSGHNAPTVDTNSCIQCGKCTNFCPRGALLYKSAELSS
ncbi:MAG: putative 4Fe-4S ferredoxin iron-sulfur binding domain protein [Clostridiaceae bacterium]|jgi:Fe-S-cluster-containing hydrogenase component 2|nr:putative 4Fe-4S ferredoxin iron-sulfur binding domain protein [Clostridiaceae bacterium]